MKNCDNKKSDKIRIFVGYYKPNYVFESNVFQPLLTSSIEWEEQPNILRDNTGINIADKNKNYAELSGHYWVWKNFLPTTDVKYVGFCHYRRFLDFNITPTPEVPLYPMFFKDFKKIFEKYTEENIMERIEGYDIVLPHLSTLEIPMYKQYEVFHPIKEMNMALEVLAELYPEYLDYVRDFLHTQELYICINFIMKKELLEEYMEWIFNILTTLEARSDWSQYSEYMDVRVPAFIAERFLNLWLMHNIKTRNLKVLNSSSIYLMGQEYSDIDPDFFVARYEVFVKKLMEKKSDKTD